MPSETPTDDTERGQTYDEACDDVIMKSAAVIADLEKRAAEHRALGEIGKAEELEAQSQALAEPVADLIEKRRSLPFGNLTEEQRESFFGLFGIDPRPIDTKAEQSEESDRDE